jgi:hypothetical protein
MSFTAAADRLYGNTSTHATCLRLSSYTLCDTSKNLLNVTDMYSLCQGHITTFVVQMTPTVTVFNGTIHATVYDKVLNVKLYSANEDLCKTTTSCPYLKGVPANISYVVKTPRDLPSSLRAHVVMTAVTSDALGTVADSQTEVVCIDAKFGY